MNTIYAQLEITKNVTYRTEFGGNFGTTLNGPFTPRYTYGEIEVKNNALSIADHYNDFWVIKNESITLHNFIKLL